MPPIEPRKIERYAELLAGDACSQAEAIRASDIGLTKAKSLLKDEGFQGMVRAKKQTLAGYIATARGVVQDLLVAVNDEGDPAWGLRRVGAELALKHGEVLDVDMDEVDTDALPAGVVKVYPSQYDDELDPALPGGGPVSLPVVEAEGVAVSGGGEGALDEDEEVEAEDSLPLVEEPAEEPGAAPPVRYPGLDGCIADD